jgi:signal transduction histidine kinase
MQTVQVALRRMSPELPANIQAAELAGLPFENIAEYLAQRQIPAMLETVLKSGSRAADIIQDMLRFSRRENTEKRSIDINELVDLAIKFAEKERRSYDFKQIEVQKIYGALPPVSCSATQIQQVLLNIIKNGAEAMASWEQMSRPQKLLIHTQTKGESVRIVIEDNGPGMSQAVRKRIFEPFYTTKAEGVGTGLGLSISYFIITQNHQGAIEVASAADKGTRFTIDLPIRSPEELAEV